MTGLWNLSYVFPTDIEAFTKLQLGIKDEEPTLLNFQKYVVSWFNSAKFRDIELRQYKR